MYKHFVLFFIGIILTACTGIPNVELQQKDIKENIKTVAKVKIFFGHQSVGQNIVDGLSGIVKESGDTSFHIINVHKTEKLPKFYFAHTKVGKNRKPETKCTDFAGIIENNLAKDGLQYAFLKFCFVDITEKTDIGAVFDRYRKTIDSLKMQFPQIHFIHFTVPLKTKTKGTKAWLKRLFGILGKREINNMQRFRYNQLLKKNYHAEPVFDIASIESTYPDGSRETFTKNNKTYYAMLDGYSSDGGHLNAIGRKQVAGKLLSFLAGLIKKNEKTH